ncbi:MFS transporter [Rhizobium sp. BR 314]|uniref:MFS transporter n=1 Tax=Rhizobium sp. BR 314 TaxID=3040013 RepID=UPI0039BEDBCD
MSRPATPLLILVAVLLAANGILATSLPLGWARDGLSSRTIALFGACLYTGVLLGGLAGQSLVTRMGCRRSFIIFIAVFAAMNASFLLPGHPVLFAAARIGAGAAIAGLYLLIESRMNTIAAPAHRQRLLALYMIIVYAAQATGSAVAGLIPTISLLSALALIVSCMFWWSSFPSKPAMMATAPVGATRDLVALLKSSSAALVVGLAAGISLSCFYGMGPLFATAALKDGSLAGIFMAMAMIGGMLGLAVTGGVSDRLGTGTSLSTALLATAMTSFMLAASIDRSTSCIMIIAMLFGASAFSLYPLGSAAMNAAAPAAQRITANSVFIVTTGLGGMAGPLVANALPRAVATQAPFLVIGAATLIGSLFVLVRLFVTPAGTSRSCHN